VSLRLWLYCEMLLAGFYLSTPLKFTEGRLGEACRLSVGKLDNRGLDVALGLVLGVVRDAQMRAAEEPPRSSVIRHQR
jgi:hypothetical protein